MSSIKLLTIDKIYSLNVRLKLICIQIQNRKLPFSESHNIYTHRNAVGIYRYHNVHNSQKTLHKTFEDFANRKSRQKFTNFFLQLVPVTEVSKYNINVNCIKLGIKRMS